MEKEKEKRKILSSKTFIAVDCFLKNEFTFIIFLSSLKKQTTINLNSEATQFWRKPGIGRWKIKLLKHYKRFFSPFQSMPASVRIYWEVDIGLNKKWTAGWVNWNYSLLKITQNVQRPHFIKCYFSITKGNFIPKFSMLLFNAKQTNRLRNFRGFCRKCIQRANFERKKILKLFYLFGVSMRAVRQVGYLCMQKMWITYFCRWKGRKRKCYM